MSKHKQDLPAPHPELDATGLMGLVRLGKVDAVRRYFDETLHGREITRPAWQHLRAAVEAYNVPMVKLLVTWGAKPTPQELHDLVAERQDKAAKDILCMRLAGVDLHSLPVQVQHDTPATANETPVAPPAPKAPLLTPDQIPQEWKDLLQALHQAGAPEAMIAGGALRDLCNHRSVKDVDIFLADRWMNKRLIKKAFAASGLTIQNQMVSTGYGAVAQKMTRGTKDAFNEVTRAIKRDSYGQAFEHKKVKEGAEAWTIVAGRRTPEKNGMLCTEYNIVFLKGELGKDLRATRPGIMAATLLLEQFDIGLCQIAYDGKDVQMLKRFVDDVEKKTLTLVRPNHATKAHLERVVKKYPDFTLCQNAQNLLTPPAPVKTIKKITVATKRAISGYGHVSRPSSRNRGFSGY